MAGPRSALAELALLQVELALDAVQRVAADRAVLEQADRLRPLEPQQRTPDLVVARVDRLDAVRHLAVPVQPLGRPPSALLQPVAQLALDGLRDRLLAD